MRDIIRVCIPDSHGTHIDVAARDAFLADLKLLAPDQIIWLGDHVDCGGLYSGHPQSYVAELDESYEDDIEATASFMDLVSNLAPKAEQHYIQGNHEQRFERWLSRTYRNSKDATACYERMSPEARLDLKTRGIKYYKMGEYYGGLHLPGTLRLGKCYYTHGSKVCANAARAHRLQFGACVVHGHTHRAQSDIGRSVAAGEHGAWCPGTLAKLQPFYFHTNLSDHSHGYLIQFVAGSGRFMTLNVPILDGKSMLKPLTSRMKV